MTTDEKITDTVWCEECQADVTLSRDAMGFWCCDVCGRTPQDVEGTRYDDLDGALQEKLDELDALVAQLADRNAPYWKLEPYGTQPVELHPCGGLTPMEIGRGPVCGSYGQAVALCIALNRRRVEQHGKRRMGPTLTPRGKWLDRFKRDAGPGR